MCYPFLEIYRPSRFYSRTCFILVLCMQAPSYSCCSWKATEKKVHNYVTELIITKYNINIYREFKLVFFSAYFTLKMEVICSSEISVDFQRTRRCYIPADGTLINAISKRKGTYTKLKN
jgi:hypothetical protein